MEWGRWVVLFLPALRESGRYGREHQSHRSELPGVRKNLQSPPDYFPDWLIFFPIVASLDKFHAIASIERCCDISMGYTMRRQCRFGADLFVGKNASLWGRPHVADKDITHIAMC